MKEHEALKVLAQLQQSKGWAYIRETMEQEILRAAHDLAKRPVMSVDEIHFRRGAMWAATLLVDLPQRLQSQLENELLLRGETTPATAGSLSATADKRSES